MDDITDKINEAQDNGDWMVVIDRELSDDEKTTLEAFGYTLSERNGKFKYTTIMWN